MPTRCQRCSRRYRGQTNWNVVVDKGVTTGILCPDCQTPEENAEAEINEATLDYQGSLSDGRLWAVPKDIKSAD